MADRNGSLTPKDETGRANRVGEARVRDALARLAGEDPPDAAARIARLRALGVLVFLEMDETYRTFEALAEKPGRSSLHQQWAAERLAWLRLEIEKADAKIFSEEIETVKTKPVRSPEPERIVEYVDPEWWRFMKAQAAAYKRLLFWGGLALGVLLLLALLGVL